MGRRCRCKGRPGCNCDQPPGGAAVMIPHKAGTMVATSMRFPVDGSGPNAGGMGRMADRDWTVNTWAGAPTHVEARGRWSRGDLYRSAMPVMDHDATNPGPMYDPTDPRTWPANWPNPTYGQQ